MKFCNVCHREPTYPLCALASQARPCELTHNLCVLVLGGAWEWGRRCERGGMVLGCVVKES